MDKKIKNDHGKGSNMITFILAYKNLLTNREEVTKGFFDLVHSFLDRNRGLECIVSDFGSNDGIEPFLLNNYPRIRYIYTEPNDNQFINISKCLNNGILNARNPIIAPVGPDLRWNESLIYNVLDLFRILGPIILRVECFKLNEEKKIQDVTFSPYFFLRENVIKAKGFDERMHGWGKEEDDLIERIFRYQNIMEIKVRGIAYTHIWHPETLREKYDVEGNINTRIMLENIVNNGEKLVNSYW